MKRFITIILMSLVSFSLIAQDYTGTWHGLLKASGIQLRVIFHVTEAENGYSTTMDSPYQGVSGIPVTHTIIENPSIIFEITNAQIKYVGHFKEDKIVGIFKQRGKEFPMDLTRATQEKEIV